MNASIGSFTLDWMSDLRMFGFQIMSYTFSISKQMAMRYSFSWNASHMSVCILFRTSTVEQYWQKLY